MWSVACLLPTSPDLAAHVRILTFNFVRNSVSSLGVTSDQAPLIRDILKPMERRIDEITKQGNDATNLANNRVLKIFFLACEELEDYIADGIVAPEIAISVEESQL
ncbi:hypothetical protein MMC07_008694 [Pseudocyphellaria aurata]|nr:hypothetical protein [Pseudocyphellaria aurata]